MRSVALALMLLLIPTLALAVPQTVTLMWDHDGDVDLAGFKIYWGRYPGMYGPYQGYGGYPGGGIQDVPDPAARQTTVSNLPEGLIYFAATAYDTSGNESGYSNEISKDDSIAPATPMGFNLIGSKPVP
jgi:hypothetical protein